MKNKIMAALIAGALSIAPAMYGQVENSAQGKKDEQKQQQADRAGQETITGCLTEQAGAFKLATSAGEQYDVNGSNLDKHKDHTVKLTGTTTSDGGKKTMAVSKIEHVSGSCAK